MFGKIKKWFSIPCTLYQLLMCGTMAVASSSGAVSAIAQRGRCNKEEANQILQHNLKPLARQSKRGHSGVFQQDFAKHLLMASLKVKLVLYVEGAPFAIII